MAERFWAMVAGGDGCWEWQGARHRRGYGAFGVDRETMVYAHRMAWELTNGPVPDGLFVCHHCDNPPCCRPDHLFLGTHTDNMADMRAKGRAPKERPLQRGEFNARSKLTVDVVRAIRASDLSNAEWGRRLGVTSNCINQVRRRKAWKWVA